MCVCVFTTSFLFIHLGHLGCFHILAVVSNAAVDLGVHIYLFELVFLFSLGKKYPEVELLDQMVVLCLIFGEAPYCFPQRLHQFTFPPTAHECSPFYTSLPTLAISCPFHCSHSDRCEVIFHCGFDLHFPDD